MKVSDPNWVFLMILCLSFIASASPQCQEDQQSLLLNLKLSFSFNSSKSYKLLSWELGKDCCEWKGISCDVGGLGHVVGLDLSNDSISGWKYSHGISGLSYLLSLNLSFNNFSMKIPAGIANLTQLKALNLSNAGFTGEIPIQISGLANLVVLDLSVSALYSNESPQLAKAGLRSLVKNLIHLRELYLDGMDLSGSVADWGTVLSSLLPNLQVLSLVSCNLSGDIHDSLKDMRFLSRIYLKGNNFFTEVPPFFSSFSKLKILSLSSCGLQGNFPEAVWRIQSLESVDLSNNKKLNISFQKFAHNQSLRELLLSDTYIVDGLLESFGFLTNLSRVEAQRCNLTGKIPPFLGNLSQLWRLDLSSNNLSSSIPSFRKLRHLEYLDLSNNQLSGNIPSSYFEGLQNLKALKLSNNQFFGTIPESMWACSSLELLDLSSNQFNGPIPTFRSSLPSLKTLNLKENNLSGSIPNSVFVLKNLNVLSLSSNKLNGLIDLNLVKRLSNLTALDLSFNYLTVEVNSELPNGVSFPQLSTLNLASCNVSGFPELGNQSKLYRLDLSNNRIPDVRPWLEQYAKDSLQFLNLSINLLSSLPNLSSYKNLAVLDVHDNNLHQKIPKLPNSLVYVDFSNNNFSMAINPDVTNVTQAVFFSLANNKFSGDIPESLCNAASMKVLDLSNNSLEGPIPSCLFNNNQSLAILNLKRNKLSGIIADIFQEDCKLQSLDLSSNGLEGSIPSSISNCLKLEVLDLGNNLFDGTFPCCLNNTSLRVLILRNNSLGGSIGCVPSGWPRLQIVDIARNEFNGTLSGEDLQSWTAMMNGTRNSQDHLKFSTLELNGKYYQDSITMTIKGLQVELVKVLTVFTSVDFSCNRFEGPLPETIGNLTALYLLNLSHNSFSGPIPATIGKIAQLESLDLSFNNFSAAIPQQLATLSFLSFLNVSYNELSGKIPVGTQLQSLSQYSFIGNPGLCGPPLPICRNSTASNPLTRHSSKNINWLFVLPGMGFGMGAAAVVAPLLFCEQVKLWYEETVDKVLAMLLSLIGFVYFTKEDWRREGEKCIEDDHPISDDDDDDEEDDEIYGNDPLSGEVYCVFCTKLDVTMKRVVHDPQCACYHLASTFASSASD